MAVIDIRTGEVIKGTLKRRALRLVQDWVELHQNELNYNWKEGSKDNPNFNKIEPLE